MPLPVLAAVLLLLFVVAGCGRPGAERGVSPREWKSVIRDWYDGRFDHRHRCAAVREAIRQLPGDLVYSTVYRDFHAYERVVCVTPACSGCPSGGTPFQRRVLNASLTALKATGVSVEVSTPPKGLSLKWHRRERELIFSGVFDAESQWKSLITAGVFAARGIAFTWISIPYRGTQRYHHVTGRFDPATRAEVVRAINRAADAAGVRVDAIELFHPFTFAPVVTVTVPDRRRFERQGGLHLQVLLDYSNPRVEGIFLIARDTHGLVWSRGGTAVRLGTGAGTWPGSSHG